PPRSLLLLFPRNFSRLRLGSCGGLLLLAELISEANCKMYLSILFDRQILLSKGALQLESIRLHLSMESSGFSFRFLRSLLLPLLYLVDVHRVFNCHVQPRARKSPLYRIWFSSGTRAPLVKAGNQRSVAA